MGSLDVYGKEDLTLRGASEEQIVLSVALFDEPPLVLRLICLVTVMIYEFDELLRQ